MNTDSDNALFSLHLSRWVFTPKMLPTVVVLILLPILFGLGYWQLKRAQFKYYLQQQFAHRMAAGEVSLSMIKHDPKKWQYAKVVVKGQFDNNHQIFLDNRVHNHQVGYQVLTPFYPKGGHQALIVNRGWVPRLRDRGHFPAISPVLEQQTVIGQVRVPAKPFMLAQQIPQNQWPLLIQAVQLDKISQMLGKPVYPFVVLLDPEAKHGFVREWPVVVAGPHKHRAYALQWFALALALMIIYFVMNTRRLK